ncbi:MAG: carboxylesterase family protein [Planctomycetes bacterium]|nr:carboxylesterase family protein [Planctomycetota bacterium]
MSNAARRNELGATHGAEILYVFDTLPRLGFGVDATDRALARTMLTTWVRFARTGDPNGAGLPTWPEYTTQSDSHLEFGDEVRVGSALLREDCDFFDRLEK